MLAFVRIRKSVVYLLLNEKAERYYGLAQKEMNVSERFSDMQGIRLSCWIGCRLLRDWVAKPVWAF